MHYIKYFFKTTLTGLQFIELAVFIAAGKKVGHILLGKLFLIAGLVLVHRKGFYRYSQSFGVLGKEITWPPGWDKSETGVGG